MKLDRFPLGFWATKIAGPDTINDPKDWADMGMSLTMGHLYEAGKTRYEDFTALLDCAQANDVQIILCDSRAEARQIKTIGEEAYAQKLRDVVAEWGDHPAIWGIHLGDEPLKDDYDAFIKALRMAREIAPQWEPYSNQIPWTLNSCELVGFDTWGHYLDQYLKDSGMNYLSYDCYMQMKRTEEGYNTYFANLRMYAEAAQRNNVPFWTILLSTPHFRYQDPTLDEIRWQFNTALACGAKGISWFYLYQEEIWKSSYRNSPINQLGRKTQGYDNISDIQNIFRHTLGPVVQGLTLDKVRHVGHAYGGYEWFVEDDLIGPCCQNDPMIISTFHETTPGDIDWTYVMVVNNTTTVCNHFRLPLRQPVAYAEELIKDDTWRPMEGHLWDDGQVENSEKVLELPHWYAPGQAVLYRFRKA